MIIRKDQIEVFEGAATPAFEEHMVRHLAEFTPLHFELLREDGVRPIIRSGVERAKAYGFTHRGPVQFFIELIFLLGVAFDTDPQFPWIRQILSDRQPPDQTERADRLYDEVMAYVQAVGGPDREFAKNALRRARAMPFEGIPISSGSPGEMLKRMREAHPEKYEYVGEAPLMALIPRALEEAQKYSVSSDAGITLFAGLMFALGHGVIIDPKYPFIESTLKNTAISDPNRRAERVYSKTMTYLDHVLQRVDRS